MVSQRNVLVTTLAAAGLAAGQLNIGNLLKGLSAPCSGAVDAAISNTEISQCFNVLNVIPILSLTSNESIIPPINSWLAGVCAAAPCDNSTLQTVSSNITTQCAPDLDSHGFNSTLVSNIVADLVKYYPTIRKIACLEESSNSTLCVTQLLDDVQAAVGAPLSINEILQIPKQVQSTGTIPQNITCNDCTQAAWAILEQDVPQLATIPQVASAVSSQCGAAFASASPGVLPSDIIEGTGTAAPTASGTAAKAISSPSAGRRSVDSQGVVSVAVMSFIAMFAGSAIFI